MNNSNIVEIRNVSLEPGCRYEMRALDEWVPVTRAEIAKHQRQGHAIHWNPRDAR
jgi:hypothetical protein